MTRELTEQERADLELLCGKRDGRGLTRIYDVDELGPDLLEWLMQGRTVQAWCEIEGHPSRNVIEEWAQSDPLFAAKLARARLYFADALMDQALDISDTPTEGLEVVEETDEDGNVTRRVKTCDAIAHRKLRVETRFRIARTANPARYGDVQRVALGGDPNAPPIEMTEVQRAERVRVLMTVAAQRAIEHEDG